MLFFYKCPLGSCLCVLGKFWVRQNKNKLFAPVLQRATRHVKTNYHNSLRTRSILLYLAPGIYIRNADCGLQIVTEWGIMKWGHNKFKLGHKALLWRLNKLFLHCLSGYHNVWLASRVHIILILNKFWNLFALYVEGHVLGVPNSPFLLTSPSRDWFLTTSTYGSEVEEDGSIKRIEGSF